MQNMESSNNEFTTESFPQPPAKMDTMSPPNSDDFTATKPAPFLQTISSLPETEGFEVSDTKTTTVVRADDCQEQDNNCCKDDHHHSRNFVAGASTSGSPEEECEEEDAKSLATSYSHSSKDSGCEKSSCEEGSPRTIQIGSSKANVSSSQLELDSSSSLFWGASLLYYTGIPSPKVKEHHFSKSSSSSSSSPLLFPLASSGPRSFFSHKRRSTKSLASSSFSNDMERANSPPTAKSPSGDSGVGSSTTAVGEGESDEVNERKRHESCGSSSTDSNRTGLGGRIKSTTSSLRLLKITRPSLDSFMEKTRSLPRPGRRRPRLCEEAALQAASCAATAGSGGDSSLSTLNRQDPLEEEVTATNMTKMKSVSTSSFQTARKALRDSFRAARRNFLSSTKVGPSAKTSSKNDDDQSDDGENVKVDGKLHKRSRSYDDNEELSCKTDANASSSNTPTVIKKSKLQKARKRFSSTLSLHSTRGSGSGAGSGGSSHRSKSASTLVMTDSETIPSVHGESIPERNHHDEICSSAEDILAIAIEEDEDTVGATSKTSKQSKDKPMTKEVVDKDKAGSSKNKSAFSFLRKAKPKDISRGEALEEPEIDQQQQHKHTQSKNLEIPGDLSKKSTREEEEGEKEKPSKKRTSLVRSIGKAIRSGKGGSSSKEAIKEQSFQSNASDTRGKAEIEEAPARGKFSRKTQEIVWLENEPKVRSLKPSQKEIILPIGGSVSESPTSPTVANTRTPSTEQESVTSSGSGSISQEKEREIQQDTKATETSIDFSPRKLLHLLQPKKTNESRSDADTNVSTLAKVDNSNIFDTSSDYSVSATSHPTHLPIPEGESRISGTGESSQKDVITSPEKINERQSKVKIKKKGKSQSLIASLVFSTNPLVKKETSNNIEMDDTKKKKNSKKISKKNVKAGLSTTTDGTKNVGKVTTSPLSANRRSSSTEEEEEIARVGKASGENPGGIDDKGRKESEKLVGKSYSDVLTSGTSIIDPAYPSNRSSSRKSSDERKELRRKAVHEEEGSFAGSGDAAADAKRNGEDGESNPQEGLLDSNLDSEDENEGASSPSNMNISNGHGGGESRSYSKSKSDSTATVEDETNHLSPPPGFSSKNTGENGIDRMNGGMSDPISNNLASSEADDVVGVSRAATDIDMRRRGSEVGSRKREDSETDPETACTKSFRQLQPFNYDLEPVEEGKKERLYKVLVVGELGAGKTSIIKRYVHQFFSQHYRATIGVDFALKVLRWDPDTVVRLQLWDIAGQERFGSMTRVYYKEAVGAFIVFDVTRSATLEAVPKWKADLDAKVALPDGRPIPTVLLANKSDQPKEGIAANREKMNEFCQQQGFSAWFETSAKDNINIDESANFLVSKILEMDKWSQEPLAPDPDKLDLTANGKHKGTSSSNCAC